VSVAVRTDGDRLVVPVGRTTRSNRERDPSATLLWPAGPDPAYSMLVDVSAVAVVDDGEAVLEPRSAVLHRVAGAPGDGPTCAPVSEPQATGMPFADEEPAAGRKPIVLGPGEGRSYPMGRISALFKADGDESAGLYSISEWWLEPHTQGPGAHAHPEDDVFYVLEGTMSFLVGDEWVDASAGSFVVAPGGVTHDFENRGDVRAGALNVSAPGNFEEAMPAISEWFLEHPPGDARR
jgi:mannose-6-phosphate isomerase-like protein (cupin superfamily)